MTIILLTYVNRSGSTYLANLISASDRVCVCPEGDRLVSLFLECPGKAFQLNDAWKAKLSKVVKSDSKLRSWGIGDDVFKDLKNVDSNIDAFVAILRYYQRRQKPDANSILFKAERLVDLFASIDRYKGSGTRIKYLSLIRDPRAIYASQKRTQVPGSNKKMSQNPVYTAIFWNHFVRATIKNQDYLVCYQILYHDMISCLDQTISRLSAYLELNLDNISPNSGDLESRLPDEYKSIHKSIVELPHQFKIDQWRKELNQLEIDLLERKSNKEMISLGFEISSTGNTNLIITGKVLYFTLIYQVTHQLMILQFHIERIWSYLFK